MPRLPDEPEQSLSGRPVLCFAGPRQLCVTWSLEDVTDKAAGAALVFELQYAPLAKLDASGAASGSHQWVAAPWNGVMELQPRVGDGHGSNLLEPEPEVPLVPHWTAIVEALEPNRPYVFRTRALSGHEWCAPSEPFTTLPEPQAPTATWTDGSAAVGAAAVHRNSGNSLSKGMPVRLSAEQLLESLQEVAADDDSPVREETKRAIIGTILLSETESGGQLAELAGRWLADSLAASAQDTTYKAKVKTLHFLTEVLARRWGVAIFKQTVSEHGERALSELTEFTCPNDPTHGSKPTEWVRAGAKRALQMLQDRLVDVSPKGEFKVAARKQHVSKIELRPFQRVRWAFRLRAARGEIAFCARLSVELNNGWDTSAVIVEPLMLTADAPITGEYTAGDAFKRCLVTFEWDNSASKLASRTVSYRLDITKDNRLASALSQRVPDRDVLPEGVPTAFARPETSSGTGLESAGFGSPTPRMSPRPPATQPPRHQFAEARRAWQQEWLPKWEREVTKSGSAAAIKDSDRTGRRMRGLLQVGVPPSLRAKVWSLAVGNELEITKDQFEMMVATAKATADVTAEENGRVATTREMIATDLHRTVGKIGFERFAISQQTAAADAAADDAAAGSADAGAASGAVHPDGVASSAPGPGGDGSDSEKEEPIFVGALKEVLEAFMHFKPDVGYTQGLSFLVATLLIHTATAPPIVVGGLLTAEGEDDEDGNRDEDAIVCSDSAEPDAFTAFRLMANLLEDSVLITLFALNGEQMQVLFRVFNDLFVAALPELHAHFVTFDIEPQLYLVEWIFTLFSKCLPPQVAGWIWDHICVVGEHYIFSAALGLLQSLQPQLLLLEDFTLATLLKDIVRARMQSEGGHSEAEYVFRPYKGCSAFALPRLFGFSAFRPTTFLPQCCPRLRSYAVGGVELWEDYYKAMDSFKIGPKTWGAFRHDLTCAKQGHSGGSVPRREAHAKPIVASDASDVIEMGERANNPHMIARDSSAAATSDAPTGNLSADKLAQYASTGRAARRGAVVYGEGVRLFEVEEDGVTMSTP